MDMSVFNQVIQANAEAIILVLVICVVFLASLVPFLSAAIMRLKEPRYSVADHPNHKKLVTIYRDHNGEVHVEKH